MPLHGFLHYAIVTINVELTTSRSPLSEAAFARHSTGFRTRSRPNHPRAHAPGGPTGVRVPGSYDGTNQGSDVGRSRPARRLDTCQNSPQHPDVRCGLDADDLLARSNGAASSPGLLRGQCLSTPATSDPSTVHPREVDPAIKNPRSSDRRCSRSVGDCASRSSPAPGSFRCPGSACGGSSAQKLRRFSLFGMGVRAGRSEQEDHRTAISAGDEAIAWKMAPAASPSAITRTPSGGRKNQPHGSRSRIQHAKRVHRHVP